MPPLKTTQVRYDLPARLCREIGRVIVTWAFLEQYAQELVCKLLGIGKKEGRVALQQGDLPGRYEMITTLAFLRDVDVEKIAVALKEACRKTQTDARSFRS